MIWPEALFREGHQGTPEVKMASSHGPLAQRSEGMARSESWHFAGAIRGVAASLKPLNCSAISLLHPDGVG